MSEENNQPLKFKNFVSKPDFNEYTIEEARGWTIKYSLLLEEKINRTILEFYKPENKDHFEKYVLNSSVLNMGSKLKILLNSDLIDNKTADGIRKLTAIRNGFAHSRIYDKTKIFIQFLEEVKPNAKKKVDIDSKSFIEVMNSNGKIIEKNAIEYLREFKSIYNGKSIQGFLNSNYS